MKNGQQRKEEMRRNIANFKRGNLKKKKRKSYRGLRIKGL